MYDLVGLYWLVSYSRYYIPRFTCVGRLIVIYIYIYIYVCIYLLDNMNDIYDNCYDNVSLESYKKYFVKL